MKGVRATGGKNTQVSTGLNSSLSKVDTSLLQQVNSQYQTQGVKLTTQGSNQYFENRMSIQEYQSNPHGDFSTHKSSLQNSHTNINRIDSSMSH